MIRDYYILTKPGIIRANVLTTAAGFLFAAGKSIDIWAFAGTVLGTGLVIAGACVLNNYFDRHLDKHMSRTRNRALAAGRVGPRSAILYSIVLEMCGFMLLSIFTTSMTIALGMIAVVSYVFIYTWAKRHTWHATLLGTLPGALPPAAGYAAISGTFDLTALFLFGIMVAWQMPHFYAIAIFRRQDYSAASIPVLPLVHSISTAKRHIAAWVTVYALAATSMPVWVPMSRSYALVMLAACTWWTVTAFKGFWTDQNDRWAKKIFGSSLVVLLIWCTLIAADIWLP